ncbi:hypothetical protein RC74_03245 [Falsihalocynthiibacter arcticus]|uniref:Uncharacterized protein n=1 Tax=Falsihalocynthiibacter arcticus TaxID=1579316 RepID=A0A126UYA0_9RHOB|nr:hypothetical protein RC74_03245 [Falsihalocynthiibacter arcticus]
MHVTSRAAPFLQGFVQHIVQQKVQQMALQIDLGACENTEIPLFSYSYLKIKGRFLAETKG